MSDTERLAAVVDHLVNLLIEDGFDCYECDNGRSVAHDALEAAYPKHLVLGEWYRYGPITREVHLSRERWRAEQAKRGPTLSSLRGARVVEIPILKTAD